MLITSKSVRKVSKLRTRRKDRGSQSFFGCSLVPGIENDTNIRVFEKGELQDFLRTFQAYCNVATRWKQPVVLIVFSHRDPNTYGVAIGGRGMPTRAPRLRTKHIIASLRGPYCRWAKKKQSCGSVMQQRFAKHSSRWRMKAIPRSARTQADKI